jgi:hypothetical protein
LLVETALADEQDVSEMECEVHKVIVCKGFNAHVIESF